MGELIPKSEIVRRRIVTSLTDIFLRLLRTGAVSTSDVEFAAGNFADEFLARQERERLAEVDSADKERADRVEEMYKQLIKLREDVTDTLNDVLMSFHHPREADFYIIEADQLSDAKKKLNDLVAGIEESKESPRESSIA